MNIAVVGLGLIGGSFCKALKKHTFHHIMGIDNDPETIRKALEYGAIDEEITPDRLSEANLTIICLYPEAIVNFVKDNADKFKKGGIVIDSCGIKEYVVTDENGNDNMDQMVKENYIRIKNDVKHIVANELKRIAEDRIKISV